MVQKYYNTQETAEKFGITPAEVKSMLDRRELHGYRDGADWKFKAEEIDHLAEERAAQPPEPPEGGDILLSEVELGQSGPGASGTVIGMAGDQKAAAESDLQLAGSSLQLAGSDLQLAASDTNLAEVTQGPEISRKAELDSKVSQFEELDLTLEGDLTLEDSTLATAPRLPATSDSTVDLMSKPLEDDDLVLGGSSAGSDITIGGDSGISLVDPADSGLSLEEPLLGVQEDSLELGDDEMVALPSGSMSGLSGKLKADDDFLLTPMEETGDGDESASGSQVIALDTEGDESATMIGAGSATAMAGMLGEDRGPALDTGSGSLVSMDTVGVGAPPGGLVAGASAISAEGVVPESPYTTADMVLLGVSLFLLLFCGIFMFDLLRNMWSWDTTYSLNSWLMDTILSIFEK